MLTELALAAGAWLAADALLFTPFDIRHRKLQLALRRLPASLRGKRVMHLSDLHVGGWTYREVFIRQRVQAVAPDLIAITGDLLSTGRGIPAILELLEGLRAPMGVWFVPGNNEVEEIDLPPFIQQLERLGIRTLLNSSAKLAEGATIVGVNDPSVEKDDLDRALRGVPGTEFRILLGHSPEIFYQACDRGIELTLSGHTHGGQVAVPWIGPLYTHTQRSGLSFTSGEYRRGGCVLYVSLGVGCSLLPVRWLCQPEILEYELVDDADTAALDGADHE